MRLHTLTDGAVTSTGTLTMVQGGFGGALITTDGTNAAVVTVTESSGRKIFDISTLNPGFIIAPIHSSSNVVTYAITGTNAKAQFYEWVNT